jgi:hypothetical protein
MPRPIPARGHHSDLKPEKSARQDQNRDAADRRRERHKHARVVLRIVAERKWFDALEERGYLDPFTAATAPTCARRIETFLMALGT